MSRKQLRSISLQIILILIIYFAVQAWQSRNALTGPATNIQATTLQGEKLSVSQFQGKPLLIHFWATWCGICRFEQDSIDAIAKDHTVITIASHSGGITDVSNYVKENGINSPVIVDEEGAWATLYGVKGFPTSFIVDADGDIYDVEVGYSSEYGLRARLWLASLLR